VPVVHPQSPGDERLAPFRDVHAGEARARHGLFLAEGRLVVRRLLTESRYRTRALLVTAAAYASLADVLAMHEAALPIHVVPTAWMRDITGFNLHRGCLAVGERGPALVWSDLAAPSRRLLVLEGVGNPDNVGGLFRTARAFGVDAVLIGPGTGDPLYRKAIRVSCGAALVLPWAEIAPWPDALDTLASLGIETWALTPGNDATPIGLAVAPGLPQRLALIAGAEGPGLTAGCLARATRRVRIPIAASADSLNVTVAAAIVLAATGEVVGL
jgi:tRNA G18 (ribose-2'-O)-methylase SpoU